MTAQAFNADHQAHPKTSTRRLTRYRLDVIASDAGDVIKSAGGWLFDRAMAGWDVTVLVTLGCVVRPLQIIGAGMLPFEPDLAAIKTGPSTHTLAAAVDVFDGDARVREIIVAALDEGGEVILWGDRWPAELEHRVDTVQHRLSSAARAFKAQALADAAFANDSVGPFEKYRGCAGWYSAVASDLVPVY